MKHLTWFVIVVGLAACTSNKKAAPDDDFSAFEGKADQFSTHWQLLGSLETGKARNALYTNAPKYLAYAYHAEQGDAIDVWVRSPDADPTAWLLTRDFHVVQMNDDGDETTTDSHLTASNLDAGDYFVVFREYRLKSTKFDVTLQRQNGMGCNLHGAPAAAAGFGPSVAVPAPADSVLEAEGNVVADGQGHAIASYTMMDGTFAKVQSIVAPCKLTGTSTTCDFDRTKLHALAYDPVVGKAADGFTCDQVLAFDRKTGQSYVAWLNIGLNGFSLGSDQVMVASSADVGLTWSAAKNLTPDGTADAAPGVFLDKPWIYADGGRVVVTYASFGATAVDIHVLSSMDGGATWKGPVTIPSVSPFSFGNLAQPVIDPASGNIYVTWTDGVAVRASWSTDGGATFAQAIVISGADAMSGPHDLTPSKPHLNGRFRMVEGGDDEVPFDPPGNAIGADGSFWVTYLSGSPVDRARVRSIVGRWNGSALEFSPRATVSDSQGADCAASLHPTIAVDDSGTATAAWYDNRFGAGYLFVSTSQDGQTWSQNATADAAGLTYTADRNPTAGWLGDYLGITAVAGHVALGFTATQPAQAGAFFPHFRFAMK